MGRHADRGDTRTHPAPGLAGSAPALFERNAVARSFDTPGFRGMTFFEVHARSIINRVPDASRVPFRWTINPYRGCSHACRYCFARNSHTYLDLDAGHDFDSKIVVKVNAPELVRKELSARKWSGEHIAMGTNVDVYQRAEGKYRLMPGILQALLDARNPYSILTKGTLILRDLALLEASAEVTDVGSACPRAAPTRTCGGPWSPARPARGGGSACAPRCSSTGCRCGVLMGPVVPFLSDSPAQLAATVRQVAEAGATHVSPDRAAPAARGPGMVPGLAGRAPPGAGPPLSRAVRLARLRAPGLPAADLRAGPRAGQVGRGARRRPALRGPARACRPRPRRTSSPCCDAQPGRWR